MAWPISTIDGPAAVTNLVRVIRIAFERVPYPAGVTLCSGYDDEGIDEFFGGRTWQSLADPSELARHSSALTFFTAEAFHYFVPAFMIAGVKCPDDCGNVVDSVVASLKPPKMDPDRPSFRARWSLFSTSQRNAAIDFLSHLNRAEVERASKHGFERPVELDSIIECLRKTVAA